MTDGQWLIELKSAESKYNEKRWEFRNKFKRYIRTNPYSDKYSEEDLIEDLKELAVLRNKMKDISKNNSFRSDREQAYRMNNDDFFFTASNPIW